MTITQTLSDGSTCIITDNVTIIKDVIPDVTVNPTSATSCPAAGVTLTANSPTIGVTYTWSPATGLNTTTGATVIATPSINTVYTVTVSDGCNTNTATATVNIASVGDPSIFPDGFWRAYAYNGDLVNNSTSAVYYGFYEETGVSFDSNSRWNRNTTPSNASSYVGCDVPNNNHSVSYKRRNFPCGLYRFDIPRHDDDCEIYIDGTLVYSHNSARSNRTNVWTGFLNASSEVEYIWQDNSGQSRGSLSIVDVGSTLEFASADVLICSGTSTTLTANIAAVPAATFAWSIPTGFTTTGMAGSTITLTANDGSGMVSGNVPTGAYDVDVVATDPVTGCTLTDKVIITIEPLADTQVTSDDTDNTICLGESVILTATGANTYAWTASPVGDAGMSATTGNTITVTPTAGGTYTYTVAGNNNCNTKDASITITVLAPTLPDNTFGDGKWNVFVYDGDIYDGSPTPAYVGHYEETSLSFKSENRWGINNAPSDASGYVGCEVGVNNHSVSYKRTNFPCGFYVLSVPDHDDSFRLNIDTDGDGTIDFTYQQNSCCGSHPNIWSGLLDEDSEVEFLWREGNGQSLGELSIAVDESGATTSVWTGDAGDEDWFNPLNWCPDVPDRTRDAIIPGAGVSTFPEIDFSVQSAYSTGAECKDLRVEVGATLNFTNVGEDELDIYGNLKVDGTFNVADNTTTHFLDDPSATPTPIEGAVEITGTANPTFYDLVLRKSSTTDANRYITLQTDIIVKNDFTLDNAALALNEHSLTIKRKHPDAITRVNNGYVDGETNLADNTSIIHWETAVDADAYIFPFGVSFSEYIPVTFDKQIMTGPVISVSTRGTGADNTPYTTGTNMNSVVGGGPAYTVDRWWDIESSIDPLPGAGAHLTLSYRGSENTMPSPSNTQDFAIQHFDAVGLNDWDPPYAGGALGVTSGVGSVIATNLVNFSPHVITLKARPLPISLLSFEGKALETNVLLNWETLAESHNDFYTVERSQDAQNYKELGTVPAKNEILVGPRAYEYLDNNPYEGINYYRLKQTDTDGQSTYVDPITVFFGDNNEKLIVYPNPNKGNKLNLLVYAPKSDSVPIQIYTSLGLLVFEGVLERESDSPQWSVEIEFDTTLSPGTYLMQVMTNEQTLSTSFVVN